MSELCQADASFFLQNFCSHSISYYFNILQLLRGESLWLLGLQLPHLRKRRKKQERTRKIDRELILSEKLKWKTRKGGTWC